MAAHLEKGLSNSERLSSVQGESSLSGSPCRGVCTTTYGDLRCGTCGRNQEDITNWNTYSDVMKKLINVKNATEGYKIRQLESQENRWKELQKAKGIDNLTVGDVLKRVLNIANYQGETNQQDFKCMDLLTKITSSDHKFNDISIKSLMTENDYEEVKTKYR
tara:strand:+ start:12174 stop:12659 length:486 start_codon:yes stop_codon:yes gene_type:complete